MDAAEQPIMIGDPVEGRVAEDRVECRRERQRRAVSAHVNGRPLPLAAVKFITAASGGSLREHGCRGVEADDDDAVSLGDFGSQPARSTPDIKDPLAANRLEPRRNASAPRELWVRDAIVPGRVPLSHHSSVQSNACTRDRTTMRAAHYPIGGLVRETTRLAQMPD